MTTPYVGEIRMFGFNRVPTGWAPCDGRSLPIAEYDVLYTLLGTTYGGDGINTFALPDMRGRLPIHQGQGLGLSPYIMGKRSGTETVTLTAAQTPVHTHPVYASANGVTSNTPGNQVVPGAFTNTDTMYATDLGGAFPLTLQASTVANAVPTGNQPHDNTMPTLTVSFCIALYGVFPSQG
ncbi:phage tail protein [Rhodanobacter sp. Si-c]|uniref:Phage tail protein n=1 Tax=Rhodanobacter lycopersici TaxID=3162487 RepID=A0ABV3QGN8_9GAMM